jgi:hypothetical protein
MPSWARFLLVAAMVHVAAVAVGGDVVALTTQVIGWASVAALLRLASRQSVGQRAPWRWLALGAGSVLAGGIVQFVHGELIGEPSVFPSAAEPLFTIGYLGVFAGVVSLIRRRSSVREPDNVIDALIVSTAVGLWAWIVILATYVRDDSVPLVERGFNVHYSVLALFIIGAITRLAVGPGFRAPSYYFFAIGVSALFLADVLLTLESTGQVDTNLYAAIAPWAYVFTGAAALHPSAVRLTAQPEYQPASAHLAAHRDAGGCAAHGPGGARLPVGRDVEIDTPVVVIGWVVLSILVLLRLSRLIKEEERAATPRTGAARHGLGPGGGRQPRGDAHRRAVGGARADRRPARRASHGAGDRRPTRWSRWWPRSVAAPRDPTACASRSPTCPTVQVALTPATRDQPRAGPGVRRPPPRQQ